MHLIILLLLFPLLSVNAQNNTQNSKTPLTKNQQVTQKTHHYFEPLIEKIDLTLFNKQLELKNNSVKLAQFVNEQVLSLWSSEKTLKILIGSKSWKNLSKSNITALKNSFNETIHRYVREGMNYYDGQRLKLINVQLNIEKKRGLLTVELKPIYLPAFNISFKLAESNNQWLIYDVLVQGISYVKSKKVEYRRVIKKEGINGLITLLNIKNSVNLSAKSQSKKQVETSADEPIEISKDSKKESNK